MFKLVCVAGKLRGHEFQLNNGDNVLGRDSEVDIQLAVDGISKKHLSITVSEDTAYIKDLGSSNGTFLNGKAIKRATVKSGDKIALPDTILQLVYVKEKKIIIKKQIAEDEDENVDVKITPPAPKDLKAKLLWIFKYKIMNPIYGINEEYEWKILIGIVTTIFIFAAVSVTIFPVIQSSRRILLYETAKRGIHFAEEIARLNAKALESKNLDRVDTNFLDREEDVDSYELFDLEGRIVRPIGKLNEYISDPFSIKAKEWALANGNKSSSMPPQDLNNGEIGIAQAIKAYNPRTGMEESVGIIAIRFSPRSLVIGATRDSKAFWEAIVKAAVIGLIFVGVVYYLTIRPLEELKIQIEEGVRGRRKLIEPTYLMQEVNPLSSAVNTMLQRIRELQSDGDDPEFDELEDSAPYLHQLEEFLKGAQGAAMILDADKNLYKINMEGEDVTGIRETGSEGMSLLDVAREQGFAATVIELCDNSAASEGESNEGTYELQGADYSLYCKALMGKDSFAKGFYITFRKDE